MQAILTSLAIIIAGLAAGYLVRVLARRRLVGKDPALRGARRVLQRVALLGLNPIAAIGAIWIVDIEGMQIAVLPLLGAATVLTGLGAGLVFARARRLDPRRAGAFVSASSCFNIGSIGALVVYLTIGEAGFAFVPMFRIFEELLYYALVFPVTKKVGARTAPSEPAAGAAGPKGLVRMLLDPFIVISVVAIAAGFALNASGLSRPAFYTGLNTVVVPVASFLLLMSIGMAMEFRTVFGRIADAGLVAAIKYLLVPLVVTGLGALFGLGRMAGGLPLQVVLILSSVPVGFIALVPPALYDLDLDTANGAWLVTTALLVAVLPLQRLILPLLGA